MNSTGEMKRIVIFASGAGSNARQIIHHFQKSNLAKVEAVFCNNAKAGVIQIANQSKIDLKLISRQQFFETEEVLTELKKNKTRFDCVGWFYVVGSSKYFGCIYRMCD